MRDFVRRFFRSTRGEWLFLAANLALLAGFLAFSLLSDRRSIAHGEENRLATQTQVIHDLLLSQFSSIRRAHLNLQNELHTAQARGVNPMPFVERRLQGFAEVIPGVRSMSLLNASGAVIASSRHELIGMNFHDHSYFQLPQRSDDLATLYLSPPYTTALGSWSISLSSRINDARGKLAGVIVSTLDPERLSQQLQSVIYAPDMWIAATHGNGQLFLMLPELPVPRGHNLLGAGSMFQRHIESSATSNYLSGVLPGSDEQRDMFIQTLRAPELHLDFPMLIAASRNREDLYAPWWRSLWQQLLLYSLLAGSSSLGLCLTQRRRRQNRQLQRANERILRDKNHVLEELNQQLQAQSNALQAMAFRDGLTGIANRRRFDEALTAEWRHCRREALPLAILMIDIDFFKRYNDHYGHQAGDECLRAVAQTLSGKPGRAHDLLARYGGEEFVCLLPNCDLSGANIQAEALRQAVADLQLAHADSPSASCVTISIGVSCCIPEAEEGACALLATADQALYQAKQNGRNCVASAQPGVTSTAHPLPPGPPC